MVSFTQIISSIFVLYMTHSIWSLYSSFQIIPCIDKSSSTCLEPYLHHDLKLKLSVYASSKREFVKTSSQLIWMSNDFLSSDNFEETVNVKIPLKTRNNGSLYAHVLLYDNSESGWIVLKSSPLTTHAVPEASTYQLIGDDIKTIKNNSWPETHWNSKLLINVVNEIVSLDKHQITSEVASHLRLISQSKYLPILFIDELSIRINDLKLINNSKEMPLKVIYGPISLGKLKFWTNLEHSFHAFYDIGFSRKDVDDVKNIFVDTNLHLLLLTLFVSMFHLLFDFLAFKNDINFWRKQKNMVGLSTRTMAWKSFSTFIIFLYLVDERTSLLVLIPCGISLVIEIWKLLKAFKITLKWHGWMPKLNIGNTSDNEAVTEAFDAQAMKWLLRILYPLVICGAIYSLWYTPHKSWYSWTIKSLANGVYAFGFIFMLPQLFINYKLKSVAHLPWKAFTYKAFNTFIDDVFAFIITMPTTHRLACFRDDIVFVIYLYQRWLYPVDKKRVNEFGQSFDEETCGKDSKKKVN